MIIENGIIQGMKVVGGGFDGSGNPIRQTTTWGEPMPCNIKILKSDNLGRYNGNSFTIASYEVLVEDLRFSTTKIKLTLNGNALGEFQVMSIEPLNAVCLSKITV
jgi:hypothetical protein